MRPRNPAPPRKTAAEIAIDVRKPQPLLAAERRLAVLRARSDSLADQLQSVRGAQEEGSPDLFAIGRAAHELETERRQTEQQIKTLRRTEYAAAAAVYLGTLRTALLPLRQEAEGQIKDGLDLLFRGWSVLDEVDAELNHAGGYGATRAHLNVEQLSMILARPLEQAGIGPVQENKHAAD